MPIVSVAVRRTILIAPPAVIPGMVVGNHAVATFPSARVVMSILVVRLHPVGALIRRAPPVALVPDVASVRRIPGALDPFIVGTRLWRDVIRARRRWMASNETCADAVEAAASSHVDTAMVGSSFLMSMRIATSTPAIPREGNRIDADFRIDADLTIDADPTISRCGSYDLARSASHASRRSSGQQFTIRSVGMPASLACATAVSAYPS